MAENQASTETSAVSGAPGELPRPGTISLQVISPSHEAAGGLSFPDLPITTTVIQFKLQIQNRLPSRPAPQRQRLIFRGRPLLQDDALIVDFLGAALQSGGPVTIHLVLPPAASNAPANMLPNGTVPLNRTVLPDPRTQQPPNTTNIPSSQQVNQQMHNLLGQQPAFQPWNQAQARVQAQPMAQQQGNRQATQGQVLPPVMPGLPVGLQEVMHQQLLYIQQLQANALIPHNTQNPMNPPVGPNGGVPQVPRMVALPFPNANAHLQNLITQNQQARAAQRQHGIGTSPSSPTQPQAEQNRTAPTSLLQPLSAQQEHGNAVSNTATIPESNQAQPGLPQWRVTINQTTIPVNNLQPRSIGSYDNTTVRAEATVSIGGSTGIPTSTQLLEVRIANLETALGLHRVPAQEEVNDIQQRLAQFANSSDSFELARVPGLQVRMSNIAQQAARLHVQQIMSVGLPATAPPQSDPSLPLVYLLSCSHGPQALLMYQGNTYTGSMAPAPLNLRDPYAIMQRQIATGAGQVVQQVEGEIAQIRRIRRNRDLVRIILPLGGHLWLLVRLLGFVYFFMGGASWSRMIMLGICAIIFTIAQTGTFRPFIDPIRRHLEGLIQFDPNARPAAAPAADQQPDAALTPEQMADRLLREREEQANGVVRRNVQRLERAVALFFASLVPGVGERQIAARDAAEAARLTAEREREQRAAREAEERVAEAERQAEVAEWVDVGSDETSPAQRDRVAEQEPLLG